MRSPLLFPRDTKSGQVRKVNISGKKHLKLDQPDTSGKYDQQRQLTCFFLLGGYVTLEASGELVYRSISLPKIKSFQLVSSLISSSFEECVGVRFDDSGYISK